MRYRWIALAAASAAAVSAIAVPMSASAALVTSCTGSASDVTIPGDLFVPAGESCELTNVIVNGNTTVRAGANLIFNTSTLNGGLTVQADGFADLEGTSVTGAVRLNSAFGTLVQNGTVGGNVTVTSSGFFFSLNSTLKNITSTNGETFLDTVRMRSLSTTGDLLTDVYNTVAEGTVTVSGASLGSVVCVSEIDGNTSVSDTPAGAGSLVQIGASAPLSGCGFDVFAASVSLTNNQAPTYVSDNVIRGDLACTGNTPDPVVSGNRIRGHATDQCAASAAAPAARAAAGSGTDRTADVFSKIKNREAAGTSAAARQTGRAALKR
jgi:hypothetical protein